MEGMSSQASILVVEDAELTLELLVSILRRRGYAVYTARSGPEALEAAGVHRPELILLDIRIPQMDGYAVCERLKADEHLRDIPVIFLSALDETLDKVRAFRVGGVDYITKPFHVEEVRVRVENHLALRRTRDELEQRVQARTRELERANQNLQEANEQLKVFIREYEQAQEYLIHSEKMAALGRLTASIAHEINNPIQAVKGYLTLTKEELARDGNPQKLHRYLGVVSDEVDRVSDIVQRMRGFYRPARAGLRAVDVRKVFASVVELSRKQLQSSNIVVQHSEDDKLPTILANPDHLKQVFLNLLINAIDAMPDGGRLSTNITLEQGYIRISVKDTGFGMSPEIISRLFEPFFTTKDHGSGLGLSVSHRIIEAYNGQIAVTSQPGAGTTFTITLPMVQEEEN